MKKQTIKKGDFIAAELNRANDCRIVDGFVTWACIEEGYCFINNPYVDEPVFFDEIVYFKKGELK